MAIQNNVSAGSVYSTRFPTEGNKKTLDTLTSLAEKLVADLEKAGIATDPDPKVRLEDAKERIRQANPRVFPKGASPDAPIEPGTTISIPQVKAGWGPLATKQTDPTQQASSAPGAATASPPEPVVSQKTDSAVVLNPTRTPNRAVDGVVTVAPGDSIDQLLLDNGFKLYIRDSNGKVVKDLRPELHAQIQKLNPQVDNINRIFKDQKLVLPGKGEASAAAAGANSAPVATPEQIKKLENDILLVEQLIKSPDFPAANRPAAEAKLKEMKDALAQLNAGSLPSKETVDSNAAKVNGAAAFDRALNGTATPQPGPTVARAERLAAQANGREAFNNALNGAAQPGPTAKRAEEIAALEGQIVIERANLKYSGEQAAISYRVGNRVSQEQHENAAAKAQKKLEELTGQLEQLQSSK